MDPRDSTTVVLTCMFAFKRKITFMYRTRKPIQFSMLKKKACITTQVVNGYSLGVEAYRERQNPWRDLHMSM